MDHTKRECVKDEKIIAENMALLNKVLERDYERLCNHFMKLLGPTFHDLPQMDRDMMYGFISEGYCRLADKIKKGYVVGNTEKEMFTYLYKNCYWAAWEVYYDYQKNIRRYVPLEKQYDRADDNVTSVTTRSEKYAFLRDALIPRFGESVTDLYLLWLTMRVDNLGGGLKTLKKLSFLSGRETVRRLREVKAWIKNNRKLLWGLYQQSLSS